jgi:hypothetical protein
VRTQLRIVLFVVLTCGACGHIGPGLAERTYSNRSWGGSSSSSGSSGPSYKDPTDERGNFKPVEGSESSQRNYDKMHPK